MSFDIENKAKSNFDEVYTSPTPHNYIATMAKSGYEIGDQARGFCMAAADLLAKHNGKAWPVQMLDVGCSYGLGSAFVKFGCSFDEIVAFFASRVPHDYHAACEATRMWLNILPPVHNVRTVGLDSSKPAIQFAVDAGLLDGGLARNFEQPGAVATKNEIEWLRSCNLLISTGAIGYITHRTLNIVLQHLGKNHPGDFGPIAVVTILRMFDPSPIKTVFAKHGFVFAPVPGIRLPQRNFTDMNECKKVLSILHARGIDTREWEQGGKHYADLYIAAPRHQFSLLLDEMNAEESSDQIEEKAIAYIHR